MRLESAQVFVVATWSVLRRRPLVPAGLELLGCRAKPTWQRSRGGLPTSRLRQGLPATLLVVVVVAAACSGGKGDGDDTAGSDPPSSPRTAAPATADSADAVRAEVQAAYLAYSDLRQRLLASPDPTDPELNDVLTAPELAAFQGRIRSLQDLGQALRFGPQRSVQPVAININGERATVRECVIDDASLIDAHSGEVIEAIPVTTVLGEVTLKLESDGWRVSSVEQIDGWIGVAGCAD